MSRARILLRLAAHAAVAVACLELAARLDDRLTFGAPLLGAYDADQLRTSDRDGVRRNVPGARFEKWTINRLGFRGPELSQAKIPGRLRVACLGQSESFGLFEGENGEWPARLSAKLSERGLDAEAFNASVVGLLRQDRLTYFTRYVAPLAPDVVVLYFNVLSDASWRPRPPALPGEAPAGPSRWVPTLRVLPKLKLRLKAAVPEALWQRLRAWRLARNVAKLEREALGGRPPLDALPDDVVASFEQHLREVIASVRAAGVHPVLATYPTLGSAANRAAQRAAFLDERVWHLELSEAGMIDAAARLNDAVRRVARALDVPVADAAASVPRTPEYFADYVHYTDEGADRVALAVLEALERTGRLAPRAPLAGAPGGSR
jgi:lysophospholipase L1-like esterase